MYAHLGGKFAPNWASKKYQTRNGTDGLDCCYPTLLAPARWLFRLVNKWSLLRGNFSGTAGVTWSLFALEAEMVVGLLNVQVRFLFI